jgi:hypothetical protein
MTHDQLARVFPDGRTVHVPSDGAPLKGYELARADIEKRGNGDDAATVSKPSLGLFAALFKGKSNDDEDEGVSAPVISEKTASASASLAAKAIDAVPVPRSKPATASTFQLASADMQTVQPGKPKPDEAASAEPKPQTPADIINARGFWGDAPATPKQATPAQVAALNARQAVGSADPQSTASVSAAFQALAYAPVSTSPVDRANIVAASAPIPRSGRPVSRNSMAVASIDQVVTKGAQGQAGAITTSRRIAGAKGNEIWMRVMMLAPSASTSMSVTVLGDTDMTLLSAHFVKPQAAIAMGFSDDPQMGLVCDRFTGSATAVLATQSFVQRTASLH